MLPCGGAQPIQFPRFLKFIHHQRCRIYTHPSCPGYGQCRSAQKFALDPIQWGSVLIKPPVQWTGENENTKPSNFIGRHLALPWHILYVSNYFC